MELPNVSIVTPIYNKNNFLKLACHNFLSFDYPSEKLEWIILDDGDTPIKNGIIPNDKRIKYYYYDKDMIKILYNKFIENYNKKKKEYKKLNKKNKKGNKYKLYPEHKKFFKGNRIPLGMKRNICVQYASYDYIVHMDDDDLYHPKSIYSRITTLLQNNADCVGCSSVGCFHINKMISFMYTPQNNYSDSKKILPATLAYTKKFWEKQKFENQDMINEAYIFLKNRKCYDMHWKEVIIALFHNRNENRLKILYSEPNGWHYYPLSDNLFKLITSLDEK